MKPKNIPKQKWSKKRYEKIMECVIVIDTNDDPNKLYLCVESGIGYDYTFTMFRVFESYNWMSYVYGLQKQQDGRNYDAVIPNYFDPDDFEAIRRERPQQKRLRILHNGTFYGTKTPVPFLEALAQLRAHPLLEDIEVYFVGASQQHVLQSLIDVFALAPLVTVLEYMPHRQSLQHLLDADLLLLVSGADAKWIPAKLFEYLAVQKPILAVVEPHGAAAQLIKESKAGTVVDHHSPAAIADGLVRLIQSIRAGNIPSAETEFVAQFDYKVLTRQLARCFDEICGY